MKHSTQPRATLDDRHFADAAGALGTELSEAIAEFHTLALRDAAAIAHAVALPDQHGASRCAHRLAGGSLIFGAHRLSDLSARVSLAAGQNALTGDLVSELIAAIDEAYRAMLRAAPSTG